MKRYSLWLLFAIIAGALSFGGCTSMRGQNGLGSEAPRTAARSVGWVELVIDGKATYALRNVVGVYADVLYFGAAPHPPYGWVTTRATWQLDTQGVQNMPFGVDKRGNWLYAKFINPRDNGFHTITISLWYGEMVTTIDPIGNPV
ncbi:MAG: hypothetical protein V1916_02115, partial [Patescibacteria group bacterium]